MEEVERKWFRRRTKRHEPVTLLLTRIGSFRKTSGVGGEGYFGEEMLFGGEMFGPNTQRGKLREEQIERHRGG